MMCKNKIKIDTYKSDEPTVVTVIICIRFSFTSCYYNRGPDICNSSIVSVEMTTRHDALYV